MSELVAAASSGWTCWHAPPALHHRHHDSSQHRELKDQPRHHRLALGIELLAVNALGVNASVNMREAMQLSLAPVRRLRSKRW